MFGYVVDFSGRIARTRPGCCSESGCFLCFASIVFVWEGWEEKKTWVLSNKPTNYADEGVKSIKKGLGERPGRRLEWLTPDCGIGIFILMPRLAFSSHWPGPLARQNLDVSTSELA